MNELFDPTSGNQVDFIPGGAAFEVDFDKLDITGNVRQAMGQGHLVNPSVGKKATWLPKGQGGEQFGPIVTIAEQAQGMYIITTNTSIYRFRILGVIG